RTDAPTRRSLSLVAGGIRRDSLQDVRIDHHLRIGQGRRGSMPGRRRRPFFGPRALPASPETGENPALTAHAPPRGFRGRAAGDRASHAIHPPDRSPKAMASPAPWSGCCPRSWRWSPGASPANRRPEPDLASGVRPGPVEQASDHTSPTKGFLGNVAVGPFESVFHSWAGAAWADWLFMIGLLGGGPGCPSSSATAG